MTELSYIPTKKMIDLFEDVVDLIIRSKSVSDIQAAQKKIPFNWPNQCSLEEEKKIRHKLIEYKEEISKAFSDPYYREAYSTYSTPALKAIYEFFSSMLEIKRVRTRKARKITTKNIIKKLKFSTTGDQEYKALPFITNPEKILGASVCLVWIPKRRIAVWIEASDRTGLSISGNAIVRFDPEKSFAKVVRKPEELINIIKENKTTVRNYLKSIKTTEYEIDGKMNKKYVIVKVW